MNIKSLCPHNHANSLSLAFTEHKPGTGCQILGTLQEPEPDTCSVPRPEPFLVHGNHPCSLTHNLTMYHSLQSQQRTSEMTGSPAPNSHARLQPRLISKLSDYQQRADM